MFAGIVEARASLVGVDQRPQLTEITVEKPSDWDDLHIGDSIAVNGVCLTLEKFSPSTMVFSLGPETLRVTHWQPRSGDIVNLERSLKLGDRIHGHFVCGHVDDVGLLVETVDGNGVRDLTIEFSESFAPFVWRKGSVAVHGVSLTVNDVQGRRFRVGLIPETLKRTNLSLKKSGDRVHLEADAMARAWYHWRKT